MSATNTQVPSAARRLDLDWLRILALAVLLLYHLGMYYVPWPFHVKSPHASAALVPWMKLSEPWRMSLLFLVSGAASAFMLRSAASPGSAFKRRSAQLLLPLLAGVVLIVPWQSYCEVRQHWQYTGSFWEFLKLYFSGSKAFRTGCGSAASPSCLILPTWNHLWFLPYLWLYGALLCALAAVHKAWWAGAQRWGQALAKPGLMLGLPVALLLTIRLSLWAKFPSTHALVGDNFNHAQYGLMFALGVLVATHEAISQELARWRWPCLAAALALWAFLVFARPARPLEHAVIAAYQWAAVCSALGFAWQHLRRESPWRQRLSKAVFCVYVFHQTVLIAATQWLAPLKLHPAIEAPLLLSLTVGLSGLAYWVLVNLTWLRPLRVWFGVGR